MRFVRSAGILLHPTSLPGPYGSGDLGSSAYHFVDWLRTAGQSLWQMLPIGPAGMANSPYMASSAFAGNPLLIDLDELVEKGWLELPAAEKIPPALKSPAGRIDYPSVTRFRTEQIRKAAKKFLNGSKDEERNDFESFCSREKYWLDDFALFQSLNRHYDGEEWTGWEEKLARRDPSVLRAASKEFAADILYHKFVQWCFDRQWNKLKSYAHARGVRLIGDIPFFVAGHSADVWSHPEYFSLDEKGEPSLVAGVPPDYFSATGQRWGNPLYRWDVLKENKYQWWAERLQKTFELFDIVRIDHFRGFESYWEIPAKEETAVRGAWRKGPGEDFFRAIQKKIGKLPIIAEDLGIINDEVRALRDALDFPGMKILHFAFAAGPEHEYLPHRYDSNSVVYTGTHDNDTTRGWYAKASEHEKDFVRRYCQTNGSEIHWDLIRLAIESPADIAMIPFQDILGLGSEARMNIPGTIGGNWEWRFSWDQVGSYPSDRMYELSALYGRTDPYKLHLI
jgi:4-alpha-glucanotransferase